MVSHPKFEFTHPVVTKVVSPYGCKYLTNGAEVLLNQLFLDGLTLRGQNFGMDALGENMGEHNGVFSAFKVGGDM